MANTSKRKLIGLAGLAVLFVVVFCVGFSVFYTRRQQAAEDARRGVGSKLPHAELVDETNQVLPDATLHTGRLILVFVSPDCGACQTEAQFLQPVIKQHSNVPFYGVVSFGEQATALRTAQAEFPFKVYYDRNFQLAGQLGIRRVPIKLYIEDGVIKKVWGGATTDATKQAEFVSWLEKL